MQEKGGFLGVFEKPKTAKRVKQWPVNAERYPSGQRDQTVNLAAYAFEGSNPSLSTTSKILEREPFFGSFS